MVKIAVVENSDYEDVETYVLSCNATDEMITTVTTTENTNALQYSKHVQPRKLINMSPETSSVNAGLKFWSLLSKESIEPPCTPVL